MDTSIKESLKGLLELRDMDEKLEHLRRRIDDGPRIFRMREEEVEEAAGAMDGKREAIKAAQLASKQKEVELKGVEGEIKKQEAQLLVAKTNQEYRAFQDQIGRLREKVSRLEEEILLALERAESEQRGLKEMERELAAQKKELEEFRKETENDAKEYAAEIESVLAQREQHAASINFEAFQLYEKVKRAREGSAIVSAEGQTCGGCYMTVTPNDLARLRGLNEIVVCKSCQRILYLPETLT